MKILNSVQLKELDQFVIQLEQIKSIDLMERAGKKCFDWIKSNFSIETTFITVCGTGNNGGDGLVISRLLHLAGYQVKVIVIAHFSTRTEEFVQNFELLSELNVETISVHNELELRSVGIEESNVLIDSLLGTGLNRVADGFVAEAINFMNNHPKNTLIAIDIPSGLFCEDNISNKGAIVKATHTLTFQCPKLSFLYAENNLYVGEWYVLDIGLNNYLSEFESNFFYFTDEEVKRIYRRRNIFSHKGNFGHALIFAGSKGKMGAAVLCSRACLRSGLGLLTTHTISEGNVILQIAVPEAMTSIDRGETYITEIPVLQNYAAIGFGPGVGKESDTSLVLKQLIQNAVCPLVIDADGLNILSDNKTWMPFLPSGTILTPHLKEFERLFGKTSSSFERMQLAKEVAFKYQLYIVVKGAHTMIVNPEGKCWFNSTGNPGMATAGSGDVLTGILTGLLAQGYSSLESCLLGVYLHGLSGDFSASKMSQEAMLASDIVDNQGEVFKYLQQ